jgi:hypothetical protein
MRSANLGRSRAHSSAGERSLHTREVPGSIPGAPILATPMSTRFAARGPEACPSLVNRSSPFSYEGIERGSSDVAL